MMPVAREENAKHAQLTFLRCIFRFIGSFESMPTICRAVDADFMIS
jgi:hypothetical protein